MLEWHHQLNEHEFEQTLGDSECQGRLECCSSWGCKESNMTWQLNNNNNISGNGPACMGTFGTLFATFL